MLRSRSAPRLTDVASAAGVSLATASRSLAGREGVSPQVAARVRQTALELGYVANSHARTLAGGATSTVGLIVHEIGDPYFSEIASGVIRVASERGLMVQICHSGRDPRTELLQIRTLITHRIDSIIIAGSGYTDPALQAEADKDLTAFQESGGRVTVIGRHCLRADAVLPDNEAAGAAVARHVLSMGHRAVAVTAGSMHLTTIADRLAGIHHVLAEHGLSWSTVPVVHATFDREGGRAATGQILRDHPATTAVIALNDVMAMGVLSTLRSRGIAVPTQMSVAGFDDVAVAADLAPSLTTVRLPMARMGELALTMALKPPATRHRRQATGHQLMVRDSTGPVPRSSRPRP
jgi:LacI family transcriptional regulator